MAPAATLTIYGNGHHVDGNGTLISTSRLSSVESFDQASTPQPRPGSLSRTNTGDLLISEKIMSAAVGNRYSGVGVIETLLRHRSHLTISEKIMVAAAANTREGAALVKLLLDHGHIEIGVSEEVMQTAAKNEGQGPEVMEVLLEFVKQNQNDKKEYGDEDEEMWATTIVSERVLEAAAANEEKGPEVVEILLRYGKDFGLQVSDRVMEVAAANEDRGPQIMEVLLKHADLIQI